MVGSLEFATGALKSRLILVLGPHAVRCHQGRDGDAFREEEGGDRRRWRTCTVFFMVFHVCFRDLIWISMDFYGFHGFFHGSWTTNWRFGMGWNGQVAGLQLCRVCWRIWARWQSRQQLIWAMWRNPRLGA